tara:strand:- start:104 stop:445 length:342 start_codon:yes stop_codon:yes gene_type:complete
MADLGNKSPGTTYKDLLTVYDGDDNEGLEPDLKKVNDGEGVNSCLELSTTKINVSTHNGSNSGLMLNNALVTSQASEINQLDGVTFGGTNNTDVITVSGSQTLNNKTIDGGTF